MHGCSTGHVADFVLEYRQRPVSEFCLSGPPLIAFMSAMLWYMPITDVFLLDGKLVVGHDPQNPSPDQTLEDLYLRPLAEIIVRESAVQVTCS